MTKWSVTLGLALQLTLVSGCGGAVSKGGGSETGFLACNDTSECAAGETCVANQCVADDGSGKASSVTDGGTGTIQSSLTACDNVVELPQSDDVWWQADWAPSLPLLEATLCGYPENTTPPSQPTIVAKWTAPHDGQYYACGWSGDFDGVFGGSPRCGVPEACAQFSAAQFSAMTLPEPPFDPNAVGCNGFNIDAKAGDVWFFTFQNRDVDGTPSPDHGTGIANIRPW